MTKYRLLSAAAVVGAALLPAPALAADSCSGTSAFDFNSRWDALFATATAWQFPSTSACLTRTNGLGSRKLDGKLYQKDSQLWFGLDGGPGTRSELRGANLTSRSGTMTGKVFVRIGTAGRKFTVAQMLNETPSLNGGGQDPIVRLEIDNGVLELIYYDRNGAGSQIIGNLARDLGDGSSFTFQVQQWAGSSASDIDLEVRVNGAIVLSRRRVTGYDSAKSYYKAGCYVNAGGGTGCRSSYEALQFVP
jgi:hypothetical protein